MKSYHTIAATGERANDLALAKLAARTGKDWQDVRLHVEIERHTCECACGQTNGICADFEGETVVVGVCEVCGEE